MKVIPLPSQSQSRFIKVIFTYKDFTAAGLTQTFNIFPDPAGQAVQTLCPIGVGIVMTSMRVKTAFAGPSLSAANVDIGDLASVSRYIANASTDLFATVGPAGANTKDNVISPTTFAFTSAIFAAAQSVFTAKFNTVGCNLNALTAGRVEILLELMELQRFDDPLEPGIVG